MALKEQMELFENGGLMQEGGTVDPMSGNDVPFGSTQEEVRDDIPAQLSEGEFVFPADVVRYIGLEKLMQMRQEAKRGLEMMNRMGQMGNADEAVIPDDIPFDMSDLDMEDDGMVEFAQGGVVNAQMGAFVPPGLYNPQPEFGIAGYQPSQFQTASILPMTPTSGQPNMPNMQPTMPMQPPMQRTGNVLTSSQYTPVSTQPISMGTQTTGLSDLGPPDEYKTYTNEAGLEIQVPFKNGKVHSAFNVPDGYTLATGPKETKPEETKVDATPTQSDSGGDDSDPPIFDPITQGDKGQFATSDMRGVGYNAGAMRDAAKKGSVADKELLSELSEIGKAQIKDVGPVAAGLLGLGAGSMLKEAGTRVASELGVGKFKETKGVNARREFLTSQKVTMDATLSGLNATYGGAREAFKQGQGTAGQRLHQLEPEVKRALAGELKTNREQLAKALEGKTAEDLRAEINNTEKGLGKDIAELGLSKTYKDTQRGRQVEREKTYGQLFAEARATKAARDKVAAQYGFDGKGMTLSAVREKGKQIQEQRQREEQERIAREASYARSAYGDDDEPGSFESQTSRGGGFGSAASYSGRGIGGEFGMAKGGLAKQMEKSGLTPKK